MQAISVTESTFRQEVLLSEKPVLVDFWAPWCQPCRIIAPLVDEIADQRQDIRVVKVNVEQECALAAQYQIASIPTLMVFRDGEVRHRISGVLSKAKINAML